MEEFSIAKKNHSIKVAVYNGFVEAAVLLSNDLYLRMTMKSNNMGVAAKTAYEQQVYAKLTQSIFNEKLTHIYWFSSAQGLYDFKAARGVKTPNNGTNNWYRTVCLGTSNLHPKDEVLAYIRKKSTEFEKQNFILP